MGSLDPSIRVWVTVSDGVTLLLARGAIAQLVRAQS